MINSMMLYVEIKKNTMSPKLFAKFTPLEEDIT